MSALDFYKFNVDVEGHTDNVPINTPVYPLELGIICGEGIWCGEIIYK